MKAKRITAVEIDEKRKISDFKYGMIHKIAQNELIVTKWSQLKQKKKKEMKRVTILA
jgi:hypothetical protein